MDALVILLNGKTLPLIESLAPVRQQYGERVLIVSAEYADTLRTIADVVVTLPGNAMAEPPPNPTDIERLGVNAWNARTSSENKPRTGDELAWDAPGFDAP